MWKSSLMLFALLLILSESFALVTVYAPVAAKVATGDTFALGAAAPGQTITIVTDRGPITDPWENVQADPAWLQAVEKGEDRLWIRIRIPPSTELGTKTVCFDLSGHASKDRFCAALLIVSDTLEANTTSNVVKGNAGEEITVPVLLLNRSVGETSVWISCSLPKAYCSDVTTRLGPGEVRIVEYPITYPVPGDRQVTIDVQDVSSLATHRLDVVLSLQNTFSNDFRLSAFALPALEPLTFPIRALLVLLP